MARNKRPIALIERALEAFEGRLVSVKSRAFLKVTSGTWDSNKQNMTQPEYIIWESAAGNTRGWAQIMLKGRLGYMQPSQLRHLVLEEEVHAPTA